MLYRLMTIAMMLALATLGAACGDDDDGGDTGSGDTTAKTTTTSGSDPGGGKSVGGAEFATVQVAEQNGSGISGLATISKRDDGLVVGLDLEGADAAKSYPAHIHEGTCDKLDPTPKYPLDNVVQSSSETVIQADLGELRDEDYAINVHDADDPKKYVACGVID